MLNEDHRIDNNRAEQQRIVDQGGKVERYGKGDDKSDPLRVWPVISSC